MLFRRFRTRIGALMASISHIERGVQTLITQGIHIMAQNDDLAAAVAALTTAAGAAEAAIAAELALIASQTGDNPAVAQAITNINTITAALSASAATVPAPAPAPAA